jgi:hypothetical protein
MCWSNGYDDFDFIIKNSNATNQTDRKIAFNTATGKNEVTIYINNTYLESATQLSIARTILHEAVHAYLVYIGSIMDDGIIVNGLMNYGLTNGVLPGEVHHQFMAQYIDAIGYSLYNWNIESGGPQNIPRSYFDDIAWGGLSAKSYNVQTDTFNWHPSFQLLIPSESERRRIETNIENEYLNNDAAKSNPC